MRRYPLRHRIALLVAIFGTIVSGEIQADVVVGGDRPVTVHVPPSYDPSLPIPLVIALHGWGGNGAWMESYWRVQPLADAWGFLYAHPDGTVDPSGSPFWNATDACCYTSGPKPDDSAYLSSVLDEIEAQFNVDRDRVCFCGLSNGGFMSYRMACDHADKVTAIASQAGATFDDATDCVPSMPVHVLQIHGTADSVILYGGGPFTGGKHPGAAGSVQRWATYDGCSSVAEPSDAAIDLVADVAGSETDVTRYTEGCNPGGSVELWTMKGAEHVPGLVFSKPPASNLATHMVGWLLSHPRRPAPVPSFTVTPAVGPAPLDAGFDATGSTAPEGTIIASFHWDFGDGTKGEGIQAVHTYSQPGFYTVTLRLLTEDQRVSLASTQEVTVSCLGGDIAPWASVDIGGPGFPGSSWKEGECLSICVGGSLLSGKSDKSHFVYREFNGNFVSTARIEAIDAASTAQVGLMARESLEPDAIMAAMGIQRTSASTSFRFSGRKTAAASIASRTGEKVVLPGWVKLQRAGNDLVGYSSPDAATWKEVSRVTLTESPETLLVGIFGIGREPTDGSAFTPLRARACPTLALDCNGNGVDDAVDLSTATSEDCNGNSNPDECDISLGTSEDVDGNGIPDECLPPGGLVYPGDSNQDGKLDLSDAVWLLGHLFLGTQPTLPCEGGTASSPGPGDLALADANGDDRIDLSDPVSILGFLFLGTKPPALGTECVRIAGCPEKCQ